MIVQKVIADSGSMTDAIATDGYGRHEIIHDGVLRRFTHPDDKPGSNNCWVVSHGAAGAYGSWKFGTSITWSDGSNQGMTPAELKAMQEQIRIAKEHREAEKEEGYRRAAAEAKRIWASASRSVDHPYVTSKKMIPCGARQDRKALLVPMYFNGKLANIQRILPSGKKLFLKDGRVTGCYLPLGDLSGHLHFCEGWATACSLLDHLPTPAAVCVTFTAGNLRSAAFSMREKYPDIRITIACDNDILTEGNPGLTKGREAAAAVDGFVIWPDFSDEDFDGTDYNDYLTQGGKL